MKRILTDQSNQTIFTIAYVLPLYIFTSTRPSPNTNRNSPSLIRARVRIVTAACICCSFVTVFIISRYAQKTRSEVFHLLGWYPLQYWDIVRSIFLTMLLFSGPLFERFIVEGEWKRYLTGEAIGETLDSWISWRNYVAVSFPAISGSIII